MSFVPIRSNVCHKLLFKYDPERQIIEIVVRGKKEIIDLTRYRRPELQVARLRRELEGK